MATDTQAPPTAQTPTMGARRTQKHFGIEGTQALKPFVAPGIQSGMQQFLDILNRGGATDPAMMNRQLADIGAQTQSGVDTLRGSAAAGGMTGSGLFKALEAGTQAAGASRRAGLLANEAQMKEQRQRDNLQLLYQLLINPTQGALGNAAQIAQQQSAQNAAMTQAAISGLTGAAGAAMTGGGSLVAGAAANAAKDR